VPNILVADDNPVTLRFFAEVLTQLGFACELASDGAEAIAIAQRTPFDLLLFDARMPGVDGALALARIRAEPGPSRGAVALATTAAADESTRRLLISAGFAGVIAKPVTIDTLRATLTHYVGDAGETAGARSSGDDERFLDDESALAAVGGDMSILAALRGLLAAELDALPAELAAMAMRADTVALRDRLHRLDASAGFCGAPGLARAGARLRAAVDAQDAWSEAAAADFLAACAKIRAHLPTSASASD
jgi:CheY-like chemotaxis protein